jgi:PAS domain S-box-containing protein
MRGDEHPPPAADRLELRLAAEPEAVPELRSTARAFAKQLSLGPEQTAAISLAVTEATTNAVLHAFVGRDPGTVTLVAEPGDGQVVFRVRDDGRGLTPRMDSPGLGLGIPMLGRLCAHFDVGPGPDGSGTEVRMVFDAPHVSAGPGQRLRGHLQRVLGALSDAVTVSDDQGRMVYANQAAAELLGAPSPQEVVDGASAELAARFLITLPDGRPVQLADLPDQRLLAGAQPEPLLTRSVHLASGRARWLLTTSTALQDEELAGERLAVNVIRDVTAATEAERRQRFLADAGERLAGSLDLAETFGGIAELAVAALADWCAVDVVDGDGVLQRVALAHRDPQKVALGQEIHRRFPPDPVTDEGVYAVLRSGEPLFIPELADEVLAAGVPDPEHLALLRQVGMRSVLLTPMAARGRTLAVLTLVTADSARAFGPADLEFAMAVSRRAGLAIDTAQRFAER